MRELSINESSIVSGADTDTVMVVDPVAAAQTFMYLISVTDQDGFRYGSVVTGMTLGSIGGGMLAYSAAGAGLVGAAAAVGGAAIGAIAGGVACKGAAAFLVGSYNWIMA